MTNQEIDKMVDEVFSYGSGDGTLTCSETTALVLAREFGLDDTDLMKISSLFCGGVSHSHTHICGGVSGALMALGLKNEEDKFDVAQKMMTFIEDKYDGLECDEVLDIDFKNEEQVAREKLPKGKTICVAMLQDICRFIAREYQQETANAAEG